MSDIRTMRNEIRRAYDTDRWRNTVDKMPDDQITAVYLSLKKRGKIK